MMPSLSSIRSSNVSFRHSMPPHKHFTVPRRSLYRLVVLWTLLLHLTLIVPLISRYFHGKLRVATFSADTPLLIRATNCNIRIDTHKKRRFSVRVRALMHRLSSWSVERGSTTNSFRVDHPFPDRACTIVIKLPRMANTISALRIESWRRTFPSDSCVNALEGCTTPDCSAACDSSLIVDQQPYRSVLWSTTTRASIGHLAIYGSMIDVDVAKLDANTLSIVSLKGAISARSLRVNGTTSLTNLQGDIVATFLDKPTLLVNYTTRDSDLCLAAANVTPSHPNASSGTTMLCGPHVLCSHDVQPGGHGGADLIAFAPKGAVYSTLLTPAELTSLQGHSMSTPHLDDESQYYLEDTRNWINEKATEDHLQVVQLVGPRQSSIGRFVHTTNPAYLYVRPWVLATMSATVLKPRVRTVYASPVGHCPYTTNDLLNDEREAIVDYVLGSWDDAIRVSAKIFEPEKTFLNARSTNDATSTYYDRDISSTSGYAAFETSIFSYAFALVSIAVSLALASTAAVCAVLALRRAVRHFINYVNEHDRQLEIFHQAWAKYEAGTLLHPAANDTHQYQNPLHEEDSVPDERASEADACGSDLFEIVENAVDRILAIRRNSLEAFIDVVCRERGPHEPIGDDVTLDEFREAYELWSIQHAMRCYAVDDESVARIFLERAKHTIVRSSDASTDAYVRVRFRSAAEVQRGRLLGEAPRMLPGETSLSAFLRLRCVITGLDRDFVLRHDLARKYWNFIDAMHIASPQPMTKGNLRATGIEMRRLTIARLHPLQGGSNLVLDLGLAEAKGQWHPKHRLQRRRSTVVKPTHWRALMLQDILIVLSHVVVVGSPPTIFALLAAYSQGQEQPVSNKPWCHYSQSWLGPRYSCFSRYSPWNAAISTVTLAIWAAFAFHATLYYIIVEPSCIRTSSHAHPLGSLKAVTNALTYRAWLLSVGAIVGYAALSMVWWMLAVVINPDEYLAYGVSVVVLLGVAFSKTSAVATLTDNLTSRMTTQVKQALQFWASENAARIPRQSRVEDTNSTASQSREMVLRNISTQAASLVGDVKADLVFRLFDDYDNRVMRQEAVEVFAKATNLSPHLVRYVLAKCKHDADAVQDIALDLAAESAVALPARLVSSLCDIIRHPRSASSIKRLANAWASEVLGLPGTVDADLVAHTILCKFEPVAFVRAFGFHTIPAFKLLIAKQNSDIDFMYDAAVEIIDTCLFGEARQRDNVEKRDVWETPRTDDEELLLTGPSAVSEGTGSAKSHLARLGRALHAWRHLKEGKRILLQEEIEMANYEDLGELLFSVDGVEVVSRAFAGMLVRLVLSRVAGRKSLMLREAPLLAEFVNKLVLPAASNTLNYTIDVESMEALLACKYGSDVNVRSFARECSISESLANSIAFILASSNTSSGGTAMFTLLTSLDLGANTTFLAESTSKTANPTRVLGLIALVQRTPHLPELSHFTFGLVKEFAVLHLGGEEPKVAKLANKCHVITNLIFLLCSRDEKAMRDAAKSMHRLDRTRVVPDAFVDLLLFAYDDNFDFGGTQENLVAALAAVDGAREPDSLELNETAAAVVVAITEDSGVPLVDDVLALLRQHANYKEPGGRNAPHMASSLWVSLVTSLLSARTELPMDFVQHVIKSCFKGRSLITQKPALAALEQLLQMSYVADKNEAATVSLSRDVAALLDMDPESLESVLNVITRHSNDENHHYCDSNRPSSEEENLDRQDQSNSLITDWLKSGRGNASEEEPMKNAALFARKWTKAQTLSRRSIEGLSTMSERSSVPNFYLATLALGADPTQSSKAMDDLRDFMASNLGWEDRWILCLKDFAMRNECCFNVIDNELGFGCARIACLLFGNAAEAKALKFSRAPAILLPNPKILTSGARRRLEQRRACCAALLAFGSHSVSPLPDVVVGDDGKYRLVSAVDAGTVASVLPRDVLAYQLDLPAPLLGALNEASSCADDDGLRQSLLSLLGHQKSARGIPFPGVVGLAEDHARAILSLALGDVDGLEDAAIQCDVEPRLVEGLTIVCASRASDSTKQCNMPKLLNNAGLMTLCHWSGIDVKQGAAIVALVKLDTAHATAISEALSLPVPIAPCYIEAMATCSQVANFASSAKTYAMGFSRLTNCLGPIATVYAIKDRRAAETSALIIRLCQGDAGPLRALHNRLGIGKRDLPLLASLVVLCSPAPVNAEHGSVEDWMSSRHAASAARNLAKVLHLDEDIVMTLVLAGRGLRSGLRSLSILLQPIVGNLPSAQVKTNSTLALVLCAVHASADARNGLSNRNALLELCEDDDSAVRDYISKTVFDNEPALPDASNLLHGLALATGFPARLVHFLLAMTTTEAARSIDAVLERYLQNTVDHGTLSQAELADAVRVLVSLAVGDELELRRVGYESQLLRRLNFKVHCNTSALAIDGELSEHHPIVFLLRFAKRDASCFDVKASLRQNMPPIAESIYPQLGVLKAIFGLMAHDYRSLIQGTRLTVLAEAMQVPLEPIRAIAGIAMRGSAVAENRWVSSLAAERARLNCCSFCSKKRPVVSYGCEPSDLQRHMKTLASYTGAKNSVYLNSFMAGCSEDRQFLSEALTPLAIKLKIHVELAVDLVRAAQRDHDALAALASRVLGTAAIHREAMLHFEDMASDLVCITRHSAELGSSVLTSSKTVQKKQATQRWLTVAVTRMAHFVFDVLTDEFTQASLALLVIVDLTVHFLYLTNIIERTVASDLASICITLVFVVELSARFGAYAILNPIAPLDFFRNKQVHMLELGVTILDLGIVLAETVAFGRSTRSYRFVKGLRLLKLFRIARVAAKVSSSTESDDVPRDAQAVQRYLSFLALLKLKDESVALDEWPKLRAVLGHGLFGLCENDDAVNSLAPCEPPEVARAAVLVARSHLRQCRSVIRQVAQENDDVLELAEHWVDLWNRDVLAFVDSPDERCLVDTLDTEFWSRTVRKDGGPSGGLSVFLGCVCGMTTFVGEWLALIAQEGNKQSKINIRYPPVAPRLLLALKRDNVLIYNDSNGTVEVKPKYERPIENLLMSLVGLDHKSSRLQYRSNVERKTKLALFAALLSLLPRGVLPKALESAVGLERSVLDDLERLLAPFANTDATAIKRLSVRIVRNLRPAEILALREVHDRIEFSASEEKPREDLSSTIAVMLQLLSCGSVQDLNVAQVKPLFASSPHMKADGALRLLELIDDDQRASQERRHRSLSRRADSATTCDIIAYAADCDAPLDSDEFSKFASSLIVQRVSPSSARETWQKKSADFASLVFGTSLAIEGANTRDQVAVARGAKVIAEALDFPNKQVNGFFALAALDTAGFLDLVGSIGVATKQEAFNLTKFLTFCQPLVAAIRSGRRDPKDEEPSPNFSEPIRRKYLPYDELCAKVDVERSRGLNFDEYKYALHILGLDQSTARMLDDFVRDDEKGAGRVTYENFERGMERRHKQLAIKLLTTHGLDSAAQTRSVILAVFILLLIFAFIFVGVAAFAKSNTLATVVNGALPAIAGLANINSGSATYFFNQLERLVATVADVVQLESVSKLAGHSGTLALSAAKSRIHNALTGRS